MITVSGLGSGLDIEGLVTQLVAAERQAPELRLNQEEAIAQARLSAFGQVKSALSSFQSSITALNGTSLYNKRDSSSSDPDAISVSAGSSAAEGSYDIQVTQLAAKHSLASGSFADLNQTAVGTGTLTIRLGTTDYNSGTDTYNSFTLNPERDVLSLDIDSSNNTLAGISDAINAADAGVRAAVVNDGSGYRLLLSSEFTGLENSLEVVVDDDDGNDTNAAGLSQLAFNASATQLEQSSAASDAALTINGLLVASADNNVSDALTGVSLDLNKLTTDPVQITVSRDLAAVEAAVNGFIAGFNEFQATLTSLAGYNPDSGQGGLLQGDFTVGAIENRIKNLLRGVPDGVSGDLQRLSQLGISTQSDGTLLLEGDALQTALEEDLDGVMALFSALGQSNNSQVSYLGSSDSTVIGEYAVVVSQAATSGSLVAAGVLPNFNGANDVYIDADNDSFGIKLDGVDLGLITLTQGRYDDGDSLAAEIQTRINSAASSQSQGVSVSVVYSAADDSLTLNSQSLGAQSGIEITSLDPNVTADLGLSVGAGTQGLDLAGTIGGLTATASGQTLVGAAGTAVEGLSLLIGAGASGSLGNVTFSRGLFNKLDGLLDQYLAGEGVLDSRSDGLQGRIEDIGEERLALDRRIEALEARYRSQFGTLDVLLTQLQSTSDYLAQQLDNLPGAYSPSNS
ncbi:MAG: flagellar filament capping protein FliD [Halieaceae bacterium]